jgi:serine/threonine protein kinase
MYGAIAAGGMATVHFGRLVSAGGFTRRVAIKRLHPHLATDPEIAATFAEEARLASRVSHANVAAMLDVVSADGELLLVMEYVHGESLSKLLIAARTATIPPPIEIVSSVIADVLHGLHAAHEAVDEDGKPFRLVHRDVSPQNVIVGVDGVARVVDFGIAKAMTLGHVTIDGQMKGKIPYMAPEQLLRRSIDRRVDVYAAGVILWEALAGKRLFVADDDAGFFEKIVEKPIVPPSRSNPKVTRALDKVVMRALERDPDKRFATALEMALAIEATTLRAPPSSVGAWVSASAVDALAKRSALIASMEREARAEDSSSLPAVRAPSASVIFRDAGDAPMPREVEGLAPVALHTEVVTIPQTRRSRALVVASIAASLVAGAALIVLLASAQASQPSTPAAAESFALPAIATTAASADAPASIASGAPLAAAPIVASPPTKVAASPSRPTAAMWCKVFDPDKRIFVMKSMRVSRCP